MANMMTEMANMNEDRNDPYLVIWILVSRDLCYFHPFLHLCVLGIRILVLFASYIEIIINHDRRSTIGIVIISPTLRHNQMLLNSPQLSYISKPTIFHLPTRLHQV
jgi:hypothetical protein